MRSHKRRIALSAAAAAASVVLVAPMAQAATSHYSTCGDVYQVTCYTKYFTKSSLGAVDVRVDVGSPQTLTWRWSLRNTAGHEQCYGTYTGAQPPRTWTCYGVPAGSWHVWMQKSGGSSAWVDLIW